MKLFKIAEKLELDFKKTCDNTLYSSFYNVLITEYNTNKEDKNEDPINSGQPIKINPRILARIFSFLDNNDITTDITFQYDEKKKIISVNSSTEQFSIHYQEKDEEDD